MIEIPEIHIQAARKRFQAKVNYPPNTDPNNPTPNSPCWVWTGSPNIKIFGTQVTPQRYAYILHYKERPSRVFRTCLTPNCVNPLHLSDKAPPVTELSDLQRIAITNAVAYAIWNVFRTHRISTSPDCPPFALCIKGYPTLSSPGMTGDTVRSVACTNKIYLEIDDISEERPIDASNLAQSLADLFKETEETVLTGICQGHNMTESGFSEKDVEDSLKEATKIIAEQSQSVRGPLPTKFKVKQVDSPGHKYNKLWYIACGYVYLHQDGKIRGTATSSDGPTGYYRTEAEAAATLSKFEAS